MASPRAATPAPTGLARVQRVLAYMTGAVVLLSILCLAVVLIASASGMTGPQFATGAWPIVSLLPLIGLPLGGLLIIALFIVTALTRSRAPRDASR